jgi:hypothetical protein
MEFVEKVNSKGFIYWEHIDTGEVTWENPYYESNDHVPPDNHEYLPDRDEWVHYYDEEGHGYWYNASTGESEWAEPEIAEMYKAKESSSSGVSSDEEDEEEDDDDDESDESDDETDTESDDESEDSDDESDDDETDDDDELEAKFRAMLETPEGREALEAEKRAILEEETRKEMRRRRAMENLYMEENVEPITHIDINDVEAGGAWGNKVGQLSNRKRGETTKIGSKVQFHVSNSNHTEGGRLDTIRAKWDNITNKCRAVTRKTKYWATKTIQGDSYLTHSSLLSFP